MLCNDPQFCQGLHLPRLLSFSLILRVFSCLHWNQLAQTLSALSCGLSGLGGNLTPADSTKPEAISWQQSVEYVLELNKIRTQIQQVPSLGGKSDNLDQQSPRWSVTRKDRPQLLVIINSDQWYDRVKVTCNVVIVITDLKRTFGFKTKRNNGLRCCLQLV